MFDINILVKMGLSLAEVDTAFELLEKFGSVEGVISFATKLSMYNICLKLEDLKSIISGPEMSRSGSSGSLGV